MKLSRMFRTIAQEWDHEPRDLTLFTDGICSAIYEKFGYLAEVAASYAMHEAEDFGSYLPGIYWAGLLTRWEPRATFCLLMAHWLEDQGK